MLDQEPDEALLDLRPERVVAGEPEFSLDPLDGFGDATIVEVDAIARDMADRQPVTRAK